MQLANTYNGLCNDISSLIHRGQAPLGAISPQPIQRDGLFKLDVDDDIWQDIGLDDELGEIPKWLGDENVRNGIKYMLQLDRCLEEERRLKKERSVLQEWMIEEWNLVKAAETTTGNIFVFKFHICAKIIFKTI